MNDLVDLMRDSADDAPPDDVDVAAVVTTARRRVRRRRGAVGAVALATAAVVTAGALTWGGPGTGTDGPVAGNPPRPDAPVLRLADAEAAVAGRDYDELTSYTNEDLDADNGQYLDGVTDDGLVLFQDGPREANGRTTTYALMDPATGEKDWLPDPGIGQAQVWPAQLGRDRLVLLGLDESDISDDGMEADLLAYVFDRDARMWSTTSWRDLPRVEHALGDVGPDGRLYVTTPDTRGAIPEGGWPTGPDGDAEDADAEGDTYRLWSVSLTDPTDVRDEQLVVGDVAFTETAMVWTDSSNGDAGRVHVRDLASDEVTDFDPDTGERCNLLNLGAVGDRIVMSQYCGTYAEGERDDRVQILSTDGDQVVTIQDSDAVGWLPRGSDVVNLTVHTDDGDAGTYVYDLRTDRFLRLSDTLSSWSVGGSTGEPNQFFWSTPVNGGKGATQHLAALRD
ncbi:hypothetical protein [Nocardioides lianchengensis]|uniref:hypothetical protein n=1 Tax=Nocardioides lianchengensis TaxID=1045774 RepID=UPI00147DA478|nr:hypothetical protein [Nocardioides lianchengensis]NYG13010.1 hypothetical protein [Nocardioides lianchengensis]